MDYADFFPRAMGRGDINPFSYQRRLAEEAWRRRGAILSVRLP